MTCGSWVRCTGFLQNTTALLERYDITQAARGIADFVDILSNWYIRRCRDRFWASLDGPGGEIGGRSKRQARGLSDAAHLPGHRRADHRPFAPFVAEELWQNLKRRIDPQAELSVHLSRWPEADVVPFGHTEQLRGDMEVALKAVSLGRAARQDQNLKTRQPLKAALLQVPSAAAYSGRSNASRPKSAKN